MSAQAQEIQKHIRCRPGDIAPYVLVPGDPGRVRRIADRFDESRLVAENREYIVYTGFYRGHPVSVCSTGIGGPAASIAFEELIRVGAKVFIRVGSAGGRQKDIAVGTPVVISAACRGEGTSKVYLPVEFPAVADLRVTNALVTALEEAGDPFRVGIGYTRDAYYVQDQVLNKLLTDAGVVAAEQEAAVLFIVSSLRRVAAGTIVSTDSNIWLDIQPSPAEKEALYFQGEKKTIAAALRAVEILSAEKFEKTIT
jgi:uridine phosphorylase